MTFSVIHPNSNNCTSSGMFSTLQYSYIFFQLGYASFSLLTSSYCCAFSFIEHTVSSCLLLSFSTSMSGHSYLQYPISLYLKYCTSFIISCFLTFTSSPTPHYITLLTIISNLFWGIGFLFISSLLFLQLQAGCPNFLQYQYILSFLPSNSALSLARAYFWLSRPLMRELYWD